MHYGRLQLLAAGSFLLLFSACAPNAAANSITKVSKHPSQIDFGKIESDRISSSSLKSSRNRDVADHSEWTVNGHFGAWFNDWSGVSLDGSLIRPDESDSRNTGVSVTPLLVLRLQLLKSSTVPKGQMQPYIGVGPGIFFNNQEIDFHRIADAKLDTAHMSVGIDFRAGMRWRLTNSLDLFGEYRMTHYKANRGNNDKRASYPRENDDIAVTTNNFFGGLKVTF